VFVLGRRVLFVAGFWLLVACLLSFIPASISGLIRADTFGTDQSVLDPIHFHRNLMFATFGLTLVALALRLRLSAEGSHALRWVYLGLLFFTVVLMGFGAHQGGKLVYGADYLPF